MQAPGSGQGGGLKAEINVTPLVDVVLVLLIIFMVVTPMLTRGKEVQLPVSGSSQSGQEASSQDSIVLTITADKKLWIETEQVSLEKLETAMNQHFEKKNGQQVLIKADATVSVRDLRPVLKKLKSAGAEQIAFAVLNKQGPKK